MSTVLSREELIQALPYARRYARALTGSQAEGDRLVAESLRAILPNPPPLPANARLVLYAAVSQLALAESGGETVAGLSVPERKLLLLTSLEEVRLDDAAAILGLAANAADSLLTQARTRLRDAAATDVLIIEDEPIIAMDIEELVISCGHRVVGVAGTETAAVDIARRTQPGLILADINLGVGGDGTSAVARILRHLAAPVIFVTAYPERLLTGEDVEPAFVITKPFDPMTLAIATYQAVTGGVRLS